MLKVNNFNLERERVQRKNLGREGQGDGNYGVCNEAPCDAGFG